MLEAFSAILIVGWSRHVKWACARREGDQGNENAAGKPGTARIPVLPVPRLRRGQLTGSS
jgi:hypothetical protein